MSSCQPLIYLASPYSHPDPDVRQDHFEAACRATAELFRRGYLVFSPIAYSHLLVQHGLPGDWSFWQAYDHRLLAACDELWILCLPGWEQSRGVQEEIAFALENNKPIVYLDSVVSRGSEK